MSASPSPQHRRALRRLGAYGRLPHAVPIIVVLATTAGFALVAVRGLPPWSDLGRLLLAMLGGQIAIGAVNEVVDVELDAVAKPSKPIPAGEVSKRAALMLTGIGLVVMTAFSATFGLAPLALCALGTGAGLAYDLWFKRTIWSWLPYLVALPLLPLWVFTALTGLEPRLLMLYPLGAVAVVGVHLSQSLPDAATDRRLGLSNLSSRLGEGRTILLCWAAILSAPALALGTASSLTTEPRWVWLAALLALLLVSANALLYAVHRRAGVMACFPLVAVSTAVMGLGWVLAMG